MNKVEQHFWITFRSKVGHVDGPLNDRTAYDF
jgi:hypothetical protein